MWKTVLHIIRIPYTAAMLISAVVIVGYTALGGFMAASFTDLIQSIVMTIALVPCGMLRRIHERRCQHSYCKCERTSGLLSLTATYNSEAGTASSYGTITTVSTLA